MPPPQSLPGLPDDFTSKLFNGDVVAKVTDPTYRGKVVRGWADDEGMMEHDVEPLIRGEVLVCAMTTGQYEVMRELDLVLFERTFMKGDLVKHDLTDLESAVVVDVYTECTLEHVISRERLPNRVPWTHLKNAVKVEAKDKVVFGEWIGTVEEVFEDGLIEAQDGSCYRIAEMGGLLETGRYASEVLPDSIDMVNTFMRYPNVANPALDRVISVRPLIIFIVWNAINQTLPISEHDLHPEPKRFWCGAEIEQLTHFEGMKHQAPPLGTTVVFRDSAEETAAGATATVHLHNTFFLRVYKVVENTTKLRLRWMDGTETEEFSVGFVPYRNVDDYESWPGESLVWINEGVRHPAVVQTYNPRQRIAELMMLDTKAKETVSVLELDTGGFDKKPYGVGLGQHVLFCDNNGAETPEVPALGQVDPPEDGQTGFRTELKRLGLDEGSSPPDGVGTSLPQGKVEDVRWWGEVVDLHLDGTVEVELYTGERRTVPLRNLIVLNEPEGPPPGVEEMFEDDMSDRSWETMSEGEGVENGDAFDEGEEEEEEEMDVEDDEEEGEAMVEMMVEGEQVAASAGSSTAPLTDHTDPPTTTTTSSTPTRTPFGSLPSFDILETAPAEHHFYSQPHSTTAARAYHSRVMKEHRALASSLPDNILVRTYEDRTDLMRVLIIGPEGTPYADAPFVFDVYLNPNKFPFEPPNVYFHSHTHGLGRCNPNLYEEGKVCLSILGTWDGDKSESWNPKTSSLLQVFVSISGLVLVRAPYHCEPAFAKLEGTREGRVNSRLYSEKAYVLSRSFVKTALERPPAGLEDEIREFYIANGRLASVIAHAKALIDKGPVEDEGEDDGDMWNADAMGSLTAGAILTLKRTIAALDRMG